MASQLVAKEAVQGLPAVPPRYSLLGVLPAISDGARWQGGVEWSPEDVADGWVEPMICAGDSADPTSKYGSHLAITDSDPFIVRVEDHCSTIGWQARDFEGRARRQLAATQSWLVARELEQGAIAQAGGGQLDNTWFTKDPKIITAAGTAATDALGLIEMGLAAMLHGRPGLIHVSPAILNRLHADLAIELSGQVWTTAMGTPVVADAGYLGAKPDGNGSTNQWMYATGPMGYRLSDVDIEPGPLTGRGLVDATDRSVNTIRLFAQRLALLQWDDQIPAGNVKKGVLAAETNIAAFAGL